MLEKAQGSNSEPLAMHIFTECVANQMLMMNCFEPLLKAAGATQEHVQERFRQV
jgi:hypothetical protein